MAQKIIPCGGWYIDENTLSFDENKVLSVVGGGGEAGVVSFNGRTGAVVPQDGDYTAKQVGALPVSGGTMTGALNMGEQQLLGVTNIVNGDTPTANTGIALSNGAISFDVGSARVLSLYGSAINAVNHRIQNLSNPQDNTDAANKQYVDTAVSGVQANIDTVSGTVDDILDGTESLPYLSETTGDSRYLQLTGGTLTGALSVGNNKITMGAMPTAITDVTNKGYVDGVVKVVSDEVDGIIAGTTSISIPIATDVKVGGIKVGAGLEVTEDGTLSVNETSVNIPVASTSTRGVVLQAAGVTDATNADDIITQFNALLASLRTSGVLQDNT